MMENGYQKAYSECVELSKESTKDSLSKLINFYLDAKGDSIKTARTALKKTKNRAIVFEVIEAYLKESKDQERTWKLLTLGFHLSRYKYFGRYLAAAKSNGIELKSIGFYKNLMTNPLSLAEKKKISEYIIEYQDFDNKLFGLASTDDTRAELLDALIDYISENGITEESLKILRFNEDYLDLLQEDILHTVIKNPIENIKLAIYLDFSLEVNADFLASYKNIVLIYRILKTNVFQEEILFLEDFFSECALKVIRHEKMDEDAWEKVKEEIIKQIDAVDNIEDNNDLLDFLSATAYQEKGFVEGQLIALYKNSRLYTDTALKYLADIRSTYGYREMLSIMLTSEDRKERVKYAVKLMMLYPENGASIYSYATELQDENLLSTLDDVATKFDIKTSFEEKYKEVEIDATEKIQVLPHDTIISEFLLDLAQKIGATKFYTATGFVFSSGLRMLYPLITFIKENAGDVELITGSLQTFESGSKTTKIDRSTVRFLNTLINKFNISLYTYTDTFYHGKYYYLSNDEKAYVIVGSTNISKTAFLENYELDTLIVLEKNDGSNQFVDWYSDFKNKCTEVRNLNENNYEDLKWESELEIYSSKVVHKMSYEEIGQRITELSDEETRFRLNSWMEHKPSEIYSDLGIQSLPGYIVFLYAEKGLAVFESFVPGNAYYTFKYYDFDLLLKNVSELTKTQMITTSSFLNRGYHIPDRGRLEQKINALFYR